MDKNCYACKTKKNVDEFYPNVAQYDGLSTQCKECHNKAVKERQKTPEYKNKPAQMKKWADGIVRSLHIEDGDY